MGQNACDSDAKNPNPTLVITDFYGEKEMVSTLLGTKWIGLLLVIGHHSSSRLKHLKTAADFGTGYQSYQRAVSAVRNYFYMQILIFIVIVIGRFGIFFFFYKQFA